MSIFIHPDRANSWATDTEYTVTLQPSASDTWGHQLSGPVATRFHTMPLGVNATSPTDGAVGVPRTTMIWVGFNAPFDVITAESAFSLVDSAGSVTNGRADNDNYILRFYFYPDSALKPHMRYVATMGTTLVDVYGIPMAKVYSFVFHTGE